MNQLGRQLFLGLILLIIFRVNNSFAFDPQTFKDNIDNKNDQTVLTGHIDSLTIIRGNAEFYLSDGEISLFNFGSSIPCAMYFTGMVHFRYTPPDDIERYQLERLYDRSAIDAAFEHLALFYSVKLDNLPDTAKLVRKPVSRDAWHAIAKAGDYAFDYFSEYMPNKLLNDLLSDQPGTYFYADIWIDRYDHLVFIEDHRYDDVYRLYKPRMAGGVKTYDVLSGYTPGNTLQTELGLTPIDVIHYDIKSSFDRGGDMVVECKIHFIPYDNGRKFLYWQWYELNKPISATDTDGDTLSIINKENEWGFGVVLNKPLVAGRRDSITINFDCEAVRNFFGIFLVEGQTYWYPLVMPWDRATYDMRYECLDDYEVISCGAQVESIKKDGLLKSHWVVDIPVKYVSFNLGVFETKKFESDNAPPVIAYLGENFRHDERIDYYASVYGNLSSGNMFDMVGEDVSHSLGYFTEMFGLCPFDTIRVSEIPFGHGQGSPGLLHLSWYTFQFDDLIGTEERFRAHEVSHQWFGHIVEYEHYRDTWINEGLAEYCGYMYFESVVDDKNALEIIRDNWRRDIILGRDMRVISTDKRFNGIDNHIIVTSEGTNAGPMVLGPRLDNSVTYDYQDIVYTKGAYVYHMLRYLMRDYATGSDQAFIDFIRAMLDQYKDKPITTEGLKALAENQLGYDLDWFFDQWIYGIEIPSYKFSYEIKKLRGDEYIVDCRVIQDEVADGFKMPVPVAIYSNAGDTSYFQIMIDKPEVDAQLPISSFKPEGIIINFNDAVLRRER